MLINYGRFCHDVLMRRRGGLNINWFAFMDDDVHLRPHSLVALLDAVTVGGPPMAVLVPSSKYPAFEFHKRRTADGEWAADPACTNSSVFDFGWIQPAFITRWWRVVNAKCPLSDVYCMLQGGVELPVQQHRV